MRILRSHQRITELMARYVAQVKGATAMRETDINIVSEQVLVPLLKEVYECPHLRNLNTSERENFPGIDLADDTARIAFQITSTPDSEKVKATLRKFVQHKLYNRYDRLIVFILIEKQKTYSGSGFDEIIDNTFSFDKDADIQDYRDVLRVISTLDIDKVRYVEDLLEAHFGDSRAPVFGLPPSPKRESVLLSMVEIGLPDTLYVADIAQKEPAAKPRQRRGDEWHRRRKSKREQLISEMKHAGLKFGVDWEYHDGQIITFHNLAHRWVSLNHLIDKSTITPMKPREYYSIDESYESVFKSLLRRCLQQKLYHCQVQWQHEAKLFIFMEVNSEASRVESWVSSRLNPREVFRRKMKEEKPDEILNCKHLAFDTQFRLIMDKWYLVIRPDWFFSRDGYRKSAYGADRIGWLKRHENNDHVANHVQFIHSFLVHEGSPPTAETRSFLEEDEAKVREPKTKYPFLTIGELVSFDSAPHLDDKLYLPPKQKQDDVVPDNDEDDEDENDQQDELPINL